MTQLAYPQWIAEVDWESNGNYTGSYDDISARVLAEPGIDAQLGRDTARPLGTPMVPSAGYSARNDDRVLSAEYGASPLVGLITGGAPARIRALYGEDVGMDAADTRIDEFDVAVDGVAEIGLLSGIVDDIAQHPELGDRSVGISLLGSLAKLRGGQPIHTPLRSNYRTDQAVTEILDAAGWPSGDRVIGTGESTMAWWWLNGADPYQALVELLHTEGAGAALYEDGDGRIHFESRNARGSQVNSTDVQATFASFDGADVGMDDSSVDMDASNVFVDGGTSAFSFTAFEYRPESKTIINSITGEATVRTAQTLQKVWEYGSNLTVAAGASQTVYATGNDPWTGVVAPALTTDYTVTGTASVSVSTTVYAQRVEITFSATGSGSATIAGPGGASTGPQLRAQPVTQTSTVLVPNSVTGEVTASRTKYGHRSADGTSWTPRAELSAASMQAVVDALVAYHAFPRPVVEIVTRNASPLALWYQLSLGVSDRIRITEPHTGVGGDYWIEQKSYRAGVGTLEAVFVCQQVTSSNVATWNSGLWNGGDGLGWGF